MPTITQASPSARSANAASANLLRVSDARKSFGKAEVLRGISLELREGEFLTVLGESGSGKTTLLRLIAGFEQLDSGEIWMDGERLDLLPPFRRPVNTVFQQYALFPHLTVSENVAYGLRAKRVAADETRQRVEQALAMVKMSPWSGSKPGKISGGQQQRVALARALVNRPRMLLLDEPLSALDASLRREMQSELKSLQREIGITFLFVTHDQEEALTLSDRVAVLRSGRLEQIAAPEEIYRRPATAYVAQFIGQTNLLRCNIQNGIAECSAFSFPCAGSGKMTLSLRPECIRLFDGVDRGTQTVRFRASVVQRLFHGPTSILNVDASGMELLIRVPANDEFEEQPEFAFSLEDLVPFPSEQT